MASSRLRGEDGRFMSVRPQTEESTTRLRRNKDTLVQNAAVAEDLFGDLLRVLMLREGSNDAVSASAGNGPISYVAEGLFRGKFLLSRYTRSCRARQYYYEQRQEIVKRQDQLPTMAVSIVKDNVKRVYQRPVFKQRRLPHLASRSVETKRVFDWIYDAVEKGALRVEDRREAFKVFEEAVSLHRYIKRSLSFAPRRRIAASSAARSSSGEENTAFELITQSVETAVGTLESVLGSNTQPESVRDQQVNNHAHSANQNRLGNSTVVPEEQNHPAVHAENSDLDSLSFAQEVERMKETAKDDKKFFLMCEIERADDGDCLHLACAASIFLKELKAQGLGCQPILEDVLQFAIAKHFGASDVRAQEARKEQIRSNIHILKVARTVLNLPPFEGMSWEGVTSARSNPNQGRSSESPPSRNVEL